MSPRTQNTDATSNHITKMKEDALNLIEEAIAYMKANGKDAALKAFNKQEGAFVKGELYVFALDYQGVLLANMNNPDAVGKNLNDAQDSEGVYFNKNLIAKAKSGGGWVTYRYQNPTTKKIGCKNSYVMPTDMDYLLGVGYYFPENPDTHQCEAQ
ncbi:MAG TPA: cache domain-containing protein [Gammaproteobacteria bacterium]|nr:cache domain-containing protein [Gammaproteobacteria bacterium]